MGRSKGSIDERDELVERWENEELDKLFAKWDSETEEKNTILAWSKKALRSEHITAPVTA